MDRAPVATAARAGAAWPPPAGLDGDAWARVHHAVMAESARDQVFAPHCKLVVQQAFDHVRAEILRGRELVPGSQYPYLRHEPQRPSGFSERTGLAQAPVEHTLSLLFCAAAAATAEPYLDRSRVFSAEPPRPGHRELVAPDDWSAGRYRRAVATVLDDPRWSHVVELDVARASRSLDRRLLLADLARMGLPAAWQEVAARLDRSMTAAIGAIGVAGSIGAGQLITIALHPLDAVCAAAALPSFRLIDGLIAFADGAAAAARIEAALAAALARQGLAANPDKSGIREREALARGWSDAETRTIEEWRAAADPVGSREPASTRLYTSHDREVMAGPRELGGRGGG
ncbi:hypothetical protein, partial [Stella sp.]|uniref:hypothetical protein n=1 Tax=Stella sp. TaxID=2912054 RepID=UPI0035AE533C